MLTCRGDWESPDLAQYVIQRPPAAPFLHRQKEGKERARGLRRVVASSVSFVLAFGPKAQSLRCSSFPHQTRFAGLWRGPLFVGSPGPYMRLTPSMSANRILRISPKGTSFGRALVPSPNFNQGAACHVVASSVSLVLPFGQKLSHSAVPNGNPLGGLLLSPANPLRWASPGPPILASAPFVPTAVRRLNCIVQGTLFSAFGLLAMTWRISGEAPNGGVLCGTATTRAIDNRPYEAVEDFRHKIKLEKTNFSLDMLQSLCYNVPGNTPQIRLRTLADLFRQ